MTHLPPSEPQVPCRNPELLDPASAANVLGVDRGTLAAWRSNGRYQIPFVRFGRTVRYRMDDLLEFLQRHTVGEQGQL